VHALIISILWFGQQHLTHAVGDLGVGTGIGAGLAGGGGGGGADEEQLTMIELPEPVASPPAPEPVPEPIPEFVLAVEVTPVLTEPATDLLAQVTAAVAATVIDTAGRGGGIGTGEGPGRGSGIGPGSGGGSGGGEGGGIGSGVGPGIGRGRVLAPSPNRILLPPSAPASVKGRTITVRLAVDAQGEVRGVELIPPTGDRSYDDKLRKTALGWKFRPARDASNRPVAVSFDVEFTF
jgi:protein TonB